jgi:membrane protease YdiL (CAAX protease family)
VRELAVLPVWFRVAAALMGGAIEETLYRGYAVGRLEALTGRRRLAVAIVVAVFTLSHVPLWGIVFSLVAVLPFSALMTAAYAWRRDLLANSAAHSATLLAGLLTI